MRKLCILTSLVCFITPLFVICGQEPNPLKVRPIRIKYSGSVSKKDARRGELCVLDGDLMFVSFSESGGPGSPPLPDYSLHFLWETHVLRVKMAPRPTNVERNYSKALLAKDGWYVTADLSTDPPQVILTKNATKGSHWALVDTPQQYGGRKFIENKDAKGKAVWLPVGAVEKTYRGGVARKPMLAEQNDYFFIEDANSGK